MMCDKHVMQQSMNPYNKYGMNTSKKNFNIVDDMELDTNIQRSYESW
jgi:hypothetical protein